MSGRERRATRRILDALAIRPATNGKEPTTKANPAPRTPRTVTVLPALITPTSKWRPTTLRDGEPDGAPLKPEGYKLTVYSHPGRLRSE